jgi:hypothetical protein
VRAILSFARWASSVCTSGYVGLRVAHLELAVSTPSLLLFLTLSSLQELALMSGP